jgi:hypothetical protein
MRFCDLTAKKVLILRSPLQAGVSKDGLQKTVRILFPHDYPASDGRKSFLSKALLRHIVLGLA